MMTIFYWLLLTLPCILFWFLKISKGISLFTIIYSIIYITFIFHILSIHTYAVTYFPLFLVILLIWSHIIRKRYKYYPISIASITFITLGILFIWFIMKSTSSKDDYYGYFPISIWLLFGYIFYYLVLMSYAWYISYYTKKWWALFTLNIIIIIYYSIMLYFEGYMYLEWDKNISIHIILCLWVVLTILYLLRRNVLFRNNQPWIQ